MIYNHNTYYSRSNTFYDRNYYYRGEGARGKFNGERGGLDVHHGGANGDRSGAVPRGNAESRPSSGNIGKHGEDYNRPGATPRPFNGDTQAARGYAEPRGQSGLRSDAVGGYDHGGQERSYSSRGNASFGGGGGFHGGGVGGSHGGGGGRR